MHRDSVILRLPGVNQYVGDRLLTLGCSHPPTQESFALRFLGGCGGEAPESPLGRVGGKKKVGKRPHLAFKGYLSPPHRETVRPHPCQLA